jgi:hypothetical protein
VPAPASNDPHPHTDGEHQSLEPQAVDEQSAEAQLDAPKPPGSPVRGDAPDGAWTPGRPGTPGEGDHLDPGPEVQRVTRDEGPGDVPPPTHDDDREQPADEAARQEHNAGTTEDQPST